MPEQPRWLDWARELQAMSQIGLTYSGNAYDRQRYQRLAGIAAEMVEHHTGLAREGSLQNFLVQPGYATPKVDVRAAIVDAGKILLVQERTDGGWAMPGGWADVGDLPSETVVREVWEECGLHVAPSKLVGVFDGNRVGEPLSFYHAYKLIFMCQALGGEAQPGDDVLAVGFFEFDALPPLSSERTNERHLAEVQAHLLDPNRLTAFD